MSSLLSLLFYCPYMLWADLFKKHVANSTCLLHGTERGDKTRQVRTHRFPALLTWFFTGLSFWMEFYGKADKYTGWTPCLPGSQLYTLYFPTTTPYRFHRLGSVSLCAWLQFFLDTNPLPTCLLALPIPSKYLDRFPPSLPATYTCPLPPSPTFGSHIPVRQDRRSFLPTYLLLITISPTTSLPSPFSPVLRVG